MARSPTVAYPNIATLVHGLYCECAGQIVPRNCGGISSTRGNTAARSRNTTGNRPVKLLDRTLLEGIYSSGEGTGSLQPGQLKSFRTGRRVPAFFAGPAAKACVVVVAVFILLRKKTRSLQ